MALPDFEQIQTTQMNKNAIVQVETAQLPHIVCLTSFYNLTPPQVDNKGSLTGIHFVQPNWDFVQMAGKCLKEMWDWSIFAL